MPGVDGVVRQLGPADAEHVYRLSGGFGLTSARLRQELAATDDFRWVGLNDSDGRLYAVHRSMRWGPYLFLKGVYVSEDMRGSTAALRLAFALRDTAKQEGLFGIAAWFEPGMQESGIAEVLGMSPRRPLIYRVGLPLPSDDHAEDKTSQPTTSTDRPRFRGEIMLPRDERSAAPTVDLFGRADRSDGEGSPADESATRVHWVLDGSRLVSSVSLGTDGNGLRALVDLLRPAARANGADTLEFPVLAADILGALQLSQAKVRRRNRVPICLGSRHFAGPFPASLPPRPTGVTPC
ncbi:hypothetical protein GXW83_01380 [Streptacidiphilus sp. PB12-B1b]|uniref:hypothetical protein n=1 Tax=Streptacidiphilus sp. PB12-B1b TaxID=2705012 RepID=UPI0015FE1AD7|nr:hypothetical protein [Streptacidiphilus sp. PB12-B1b]QMU74635.1 hypothetical protein GXW83_01380 [Streptacidiphilus sp. PB12-B1b]